MAVTTKKLFPATSNATTTVFSPVGIQLNNQDDLDVYVTLSGGTRVLQLRQSTGSTAQSSHPQVNNTDGLYFPAVSAGTTLYNYQLSTDNNTITFNSALPQGAVVFCERRTRDADSSYTTFASGSTIRATDLNNSSTESNFTAQDGRNKALTIEGVLFNGDQPSTNFVTSSHIVDGSIVDADINASADIAGSKLANDSVTLDKLGSGALPTDITVASANIVNGTIVEEDVANSAVTSNKIADNAVTATEILNGAVTTAKLATDAVDGTKLADNAVDSEHYTDGSIDRVHLEADIIDSTKLADNAVNSEHYVDGSIDRVHLAADIVDGTKIADDSIDSEHIAAGALDNEHYATGSITSDKLNGATVITSSEQGSATTNDTSFLTSAAADARFFNISSGDTIKDGQTFPDNDTTIATTAAINDRIIDIVNDVGGFDIVESEQHFPNTNPQGQAGSAAVLSIKAASTNLVPSGTTLTITNGNLADNANITITGVTSTIPSGFGFIVESTSTLHTYTFHRLVPKATEVTTVAGKATEIGRLGTAAAVEDMSILGTADVVADMAILGTNDVVADMNLLAVSDVISDMNTLAVTDVINDMDTVATNVANVNNVGTNIAKVNSVAAVVGGTQTFVVTVSGGVFYIDGQSNPVLTLARGFTYTFNQSDSSNSNHPLRFKDGSGNSYTTGVTTSGTAGSSGATVVLAVAANAPSSLRYYCTVHGNGMGNTITVTDDNIGIVAGSIGNVNTTAGSIANVNTTAGSISNVNTVASNINSVNNFFNVYRTGANNPTTSLDVGDLFFNTTSNSLKVYTGSAWVDGVTAAGNFAVVTGNTFTGSNRYNDNVKAEFGTGADLQIHHDGSNSYIVDSGVGQFYIRGGAAIHLQNPTGSEKYIRCVQNGTVELYNDNSKKLETTSTGVKVSGTLLDINTTSANSAIVKLQTNTNSCEIEGRVVGGENHLILSSNNSADSLKITGAANGTVQLPNDNQKLQLGAGQDLQMYHDGTNSFIKNNTGFLAINSDNYSIRDKDDGDQFIQALHDGAVELYFDGSKKFETTSTGATVTGNLIATGNLNVNDNGNINVGNSGDLQLFHNGTNSFIDSDTGNLVISSVADLRFNAADYKFMNTADNETLARFIQDGGVELYHNNNKKFETLSGGVEVTGSFGVNSGGIYINDDNQKLHVGASRDLQLYHNGTNSFIDSETGNLYIRGNGGQILFRPNNSEEALILKPDGAVELYHNNTKKFETDANGAIVSGHLYLSGEFNMTTGGNKNRFIDCSCDDGEGLFIRTTNGGDANHQHMAIFYRGGAAELYHNANKKFETYANGCTVTGNLNADNVDLADNNKARFGASNDLQIYHDGSNSFIKDGVGSTGLVMQAPLLAVKNEAGSENMLVATENAAVQLMYDNSEKLRTNSGGIEVLGHIQLDDSKYLKLGNSGGTQDVAIYHNGYNFHVQHTNAGSTYIDSVGDHNFRASSGNEYRAAFKNNGAVDLYYDGSKKFETNSGGCAVTGTLSTSGVSISNGAGAVVINGGSDIRLLNGSWTGDSCKIQQYSSWLYLQGGGNGIVLRGSTSDRWYVNSSGHFYPAVNNSFDIGIPSSRVRNIYTNDLHLSNEGSSNDIDGTWGDWTIQEGESDLFLKNNRSGKKYKFNLMEVS